MSTNATLVRLIEQRDPKLDRALKVLRVALRPDEDGAITLDEAAYDALKQVRARYRSLARRIAAVRGGGRTRKRLLKALADIDEGLVQFSLAVRISLSREQRTAMQTASDRVERGVRTIGKTHAKLTHKRRKP